MIHDMIHYPDDLREKRDIVTVLALSAQPFDFYLAGPRYMSCAKSDSDWDFYVQADSDIVDALARLGFESTNHYMNRDFDANDDASGYETIDVVEKGNVHVQILRDVQKMRKVRDTIRDTRLQEHIDAPKGEARRKIWNEVITQVTKQAEAALFDGFPGALAQEGEPLPF